MPWISRRHWIGLSYGILIDEPLIILLSGIKIKLLKVSENCNFFHLRQSLGALRILANKACLKSTSTGYRPYCNNETVHTCMRD